STLRPMAERYDPTLKLPEAYDPGVARALVQSQISPKDQAAFNLEQQKIDQGKYQVVKDMYGNPTGFVDTKTREVKEAPQTNTGLPPVDSEGNPLTGQDYLSSLAPQQQAAVKAIGEGRMAPPSGYALTRPLGMKLMQDVGIAYPDFNANAFGAVKEWNTG